MTALPRTGLRGVAFAGLLLSVAASCRVVEHTRDATVHVLTPGPTELGVATDYGIVFLGRGQRAGSVQFDVWFGKDPSRETGIVEQVGGTLCTTEAEIRIPRVPISFEVPPVDSEVTVRWRSAEGPLRSMAVVCSHPSVSGVLLRLRPGSPAFDRSQVGAGVYVERRERVHLLGLVSGCVSLPNADGTLEEYLAVVGPEEIWRLVTHGRNHSRQRGWVYREDIL